MRFEDGSGTGTQAISRNVSKRGMLMATAQELEIGTEVTLVFRTSLADPTEHKVAGKIVRAMANDDDPEGLWPHWVAIDFALPADELEHLIEDASQGEAE